MRTKSAEPLKGKKSPVARRLFTVEEYYRMANAGVLSEDERVELIKGEIINMTPIGSKHAAMVDRLNQLFFTKIEGQAIVRVQSPIRLSERSEPQPDLALLRPRADFYALQHPSVDDILLVVEVAETSPEYERKVKVPLYARHRILESWLVDLLRETIEVYRKPAFEGYTESFPKGRGEYLSPLSFPALQFPVVEVLG